MHQHKALYKSHVYLLKQQLDKQKSHSLQFTSSDQSPHLLSPLQTKSREMQTPEFRHWNCDSPHAIHSHIVHILTKRYRDTII